MIHTFGDLLAFLKETPLLKTLITNVVPYGSFLYSILDAYPQNDIKLL